MLTTFPLWLPWLIVHPPLLNVELELRRQKGDGAVKGCERLAQIRTPAPEQDATPRR
ncbi:hypothetical protein OG252_43080 [Streptomyces sp. NBC_01352]|uniref:Uncharacterized protein n=1 Tax=Streptomyces plumbiresistens TaxID=511811 RepID=A0ABP7T2V8_9ACTN|nr:MULTISPECIES: hypothetical protein [unclassified Streptomyces]MCX4702781.1 hypothetical protein [Streptomyces sp. NBC_01373]